MCNGHKVYGIYKISHEQITSFDILPKKKETSFDKFFTSNINRYIYFQLII